MSEVSIVNVRLTDDDIKILSDGGIIPPNTPAAQVALFAKVCQEHGLSPFRKEMSLVKFGGTYQPIVTIDGSRKKAARTGQYAGKENVQYNLKADGTFQTAAELVAEKKLPHTCTCTVYRMVANHRCPFTHTVLFTEFVSSSNSKWSSTPFQMISKVAESFALKSAFGDELGGLHIQEESGAFEDHSVKKTVTIEEAAVPEQFQKDMEDAADILNSYKDIADVIQYWKEIPDESPGKMFASFAKLFFDAAARTAQSSEDLNAFWLVTPKKWQQSQRVTKPLFDRKKELANAAA